MPTVHIRHARLADDAHLAELDRAVWSTLHSVVPRPMPPYGPFFREGDQMSDYLVAETEIETAADHPDGCTGAAGDSAAGSAAGSASGSVVGAAAGRGAGLTEGIGSEGADRPGAVGGAAPDAGVPAARPRRISGYIRIRTPVPLPCNAHVRQIQGLAVASWARGRGVGRALLRAAADEARRQGASRITLRVLGHNAPARLLYASEGYAVEGVLPGEFYLAGQYVDDVLMGRSLTR
ncbi:GNAT family N-acetyltransferase [Streptomyces sp. NPDC059175]|uniref:GNAT family N-acetyltransferase n=1 Tax=Streptomyces sp. NPDC059175 TaxID=3346757 RepID=UPI0036B7DB57